MSPCFTAAKLGWISVIRKGFASSQKSRAALRFCNEYLAAGRDCSRPLRGRAGVADPGYSGARRQMQLRETRRKLTAPRNCVKWPFPSKQGSQLYETHLPILQAHAQTAARVSRPNENQGGTRLSLAAQAAGTQAAAAGGRGDSVRPAHAGVGSSQPDSSPGREGPVARMRLRFPKAARLTQAAEFRRVKAGGESFHGKLLILSVLKRPGLAETKIGLITTRRLGNAVTRNRTRRRIREIVRGALPRMARGVHLVVIARKNAADAPFEEIRNEWLRLANRAALLGNG